MSIVSSISILFEKIFYLLNLIFCDHFKDTIIYLCLRMLTKNSETFYLLIPKTKGEVQKYPYKYESQVVQSYNRFIYF